MKQDLKIPGDQIIEISESWVDASPLKIRRSLMVECKSASGVKMLKYKYWKVITKTDTYGITEPEDYKRILKAINSADIQFVKIDNDVVNKATINSIKEVIGFKSLEEGQ